jgi:hypothetical protein
LGVIGDASAVGARVFVDGSERGVLVGQTSGEVVLADPAHGVRGMWGDAETGDTLVGPDVTRASLHVWVGRRATDVAVVASDGRVLRTRLRPQEYSDVLVSFDRMRIEVRTSEH